MKSGKLTVIGAIYDFRNDLHQGQGRLVVTNVNGNTDAGNIMSGLMELSGNSQGHEKKAGDKKAMEKKPGAEKQTAVH